MRYLAALAVMVAATVNPWPATAHLVRHPDKPTLSQLENRERSQQRNLHHARYVCERGARANRRWHCGASVWIARELAQTRDRMSANLSPVSAILHVFGPYGAQAVEVARCETGGTFSVYARNGQYLGLFQMGDYARSTYGHSWTAVGQARAAYAYFRDAGGWGPWECKP